uniref:Glycoside hydrolase family 5 domain-containing protein n=1 Tax=Acrobeloides nanus TaxID=290746 RepID=A0A914CWF4_9BILA
MFLLIFLFLTLFNYEVDGRERWTEAQANAWFQSQTYIMGSQYITSDAGNQLEMFQNDTFNPELIDFELGLAESLGMTTMRIFLHNLAYSQDPTGFKSRLESVIQICSKHGIRPLLTIFDSCWLSHPNPGPQPQPKPGVMLSSWVQSPGTGVLLDQTQWPPLEIYVKDVVGTYANDARILGWDLWNEPDQHYNKQEVQLVEQLLPQVFDWARSMNPTQPLTSGVWSEDYLNGNYNMVEQLQINNSDVISFHNYLDPTTFENHIKALQKWNRPIICTEYMARTVGSTFITHLPIGKQYNIGMINWGFVNGKTQCNYPWDSHANAYTTYQPYLWFHEVFRNDGTPYLIEEAQVIKRLNGCPFGLKSTAPSLKNLTCYNAYTTPLNSTDAAAACTKTYANLGIIDSAAQNTDIMYPPIFQVVTSFILGYIKMHTEVMIGRWQDGLMMIAPIQIGKLVKKIV